LVNNNQSAFIFLQPKKTPMLNSYLDKYKGKVESSSSDFQTKGKKKKTKPKNMEDLFSNEDFEDPEFAPTIVDFKEFKAEEAEKERLKRLNSKVSEKQAGWKVIETKKQRHDSSDEDEKNTPILNTLNQQNNQLNPQKTQDFGSRRRRNDSESEDLSPVRTTTTKKRTSYSSDSDTTKEPKNEDLSPKRRNSSDSDSPPRRNTRRSNSPKRRKQEPTIIKKGENLAGLKTAQELDSYVNSQKEKELKSFQAMKPSETGQFAETIYRDKEGKIITPEEHATLNEKKKKKQFVIQKDFEWGKGLVQKKNEENLEEKFSKMINKPFATHEGEDSDYENELKDQLRDGDPMAKFLTKSKKKKKSKRPEYEGAALPNRYNIKPGHLWDGMDRSNGFEKKFFQAQSKLSNQRSKEFDDFE
jgi:pre-mRNA-splicing factor CWC26